MMAKYDVVSSSVSPNHKLARERNLVSENGCGQLRKAEETTPADWWKGRRKKGHTFYEQVRNRPKQRKENTSTHVGRPHGKGRDRHRGIKGRGLQWWRDVQTKHKSKWGRSTSQKILMLEMGSADHGIQRI